MSGKELYESPAVWDQKLQVGQQNLIQALRDYWPENVSSALDVGCGDGKITEALERGADAAFFGIDSSHEALSRCTNIPAAQGDAGRIPFPDRSFDLVLSTDVLEHLPDDLEIAAWRELFRVARDWVFIAVPFREALLDATTRCKACGALYHVNWHQRTYDFVDFALRAPDRWSVSAVILSGECWSPMLPPETVYRRRELDEWAGWGEATCPECGASGAPAAPPSSLPAETARNLGHYIYQSTKHRQYLRSHSEIIVAYNRSGRALIPREVRSVRREQRSASSWSHDQGLSQNLDPYPQHGNMVPSVDGGFIVQLPVYPSAGRVVRIVTLSADFGALPISIEDGQGLLLSETLHGNGATSFDLHLPRDAVPAYHGLLIRVSAQSQPLSAASLDVAPRIEWLVPEVGPCGYFHIPDTRISVQVCEPLWLDQRALASDRSHTHIDEDIPLFGFLQSAVSRIEKSCQEVKQLWREREDLRQELAQLRQYLLERQSECDQLRQSLLERQAECDQLSAKLSHLKGRLVVRADEWVRSKTPIRLRRGNE